jgi:hypothetical protein
VSEISADIATAYSRALTACRAALAEGAGGTPMAAARESVADLDAAELRAAFGALAYLCVFGVPRKVRRGKSVASVLDAFAGEVLWRAS